MRFNSVKELSRSSGKFSVVEEQSSNSANFLILLTLDTLNKKEFDIFSTIYGSKMLCKGIKTSDVNMRHGCEMFVNPILRKVKLQLKQNSVIVGLFTSKTVINEIFYQSLLAVLEIPFLPLYTHDDNLIKFNHRAIVNLFTSDLASYSDMCVVSTDPTKMSSKPINTRNLSTQFGKNGRSIACLIPKKNKEEYITKHKSNTRRNNRIKYEQRRRPVTLGGLSDDENTYDDGYTQNNTTELATKTYKTTAYDDYQKETIIDTTYVNYDELEHINGIALRSGIYITGYLTPMTDVNQNIYEDISSIMKDPSAYFFGILKNSSDPTDHSMIGCGFDSKKFSFDINIGSEGTNCSFIIGSIGKNVYCVLRFVPYTDSEKAVVEMLTINVQKGLIVETETVLSIDLYRRRTIRLLINFSSNPRKKGRVITIVTEFYDKLNTSLTIYKPIKNFVPCMLVGYAMYVEDELMNVSHVCNAEVWSIPPLAPREIVMINTAYINKIYANDYEHNKNRQVDPSTLCTDISMSQYNNEPKIGAENVNAKTVFTCLGYDYKVTFMINTSVECSYNLVNQFNLVVARITIECNGDYNTAVIACCMFGSKNNSEIKLVRFYEDYQWVVITKTRTTVDIEFCAIKDSDDLGVTGKAVSSRIDIINNVDDDFDEDLDVTITRSKTKTIKNNINERRTLQNTSDITEMQSVLDDTTVYDTEDVKSKRIRNSRKGKMRKRRGISDSESDDDDLGQKTEEIDREVTDSSGDEEYSDEEEDYYSDNDLGDTISRVSKYIFREPGVLSHTRKRHVMSFQYNPYDTLMDTLSVKACSVRSKSMNNGNAVFGCVHVHDISIPNTTVTIKTDRTEVTLIQYLDSQNPKVHYTKSECGLSGSGSFRVYSYRATIE